MMARARIYKEKRRLNRSVKLSSDIYERLMSLQGFLQLKERRKRSMDELIEFILSFVPDMEVQSDESYYVVRSRQTKRVA
ncbi:MAG: hypothetical protein ABSG74_13355 [Candidatus Bathyarchaeia archaeon]|jgi:hypothetical protein